MRLLDESGWVAALVFQEAANAFFYLIPGRPVRVKVRRGGEPLEFTLTPTAPAPNGFFGGWVSAF